jgi:hypothetical protein
MLLNMPAIPRAQPARHMFIVMIGLFLPLTTTGDEAPTPAHAPMLRRELQQAPAPTLPATAPTSQPSPKPTPEPTPYYGCVCCLDTAVHGDNTEACGTSSLPPEDPDYCTFCCGYPASDINDDMGSPADCAEEAEKKLGKLGMSKICSREFNCRQLAVSRLF